LLFAAIIFGFVHGAQLLVTDRLKFGHLPIYPSAWFTIIFFEIIQLMVFIIIGLMLIHPISRVFIFLVDRSFGYMQFALLGAALGIFFLPLCAAVAFLPLYDPDNPSYWARCVEFFFPMIIAGLFGGYGFWCLGSRHIK